MSEKNINYLPSDVEKQIIEAISRIKYGSVEIVIHNSRIVQIEKSEKFRFDENKQAA